MITFAISSLQSDIKGMNHRKERLRLALLDSFQIRPKRIELLHTVSVPQEKSLDNVKVDQIDEQQMNGEYTAVEAHSKEASLADDISTESSGSKSYLSPIIMRLRSEHDMNK